MISEFWIRCLSTNSGAATDRCIGAHAQTSRAARRRWWRGYQAIRQISRWTSRICTDSASMCQQSNGRGRGAGNRLVRCSVACRVIQRLVSSRLSILARPPLEERRGMHRRQRGREVTRITKHRWEGDRGIERAAQTSPTDGARSRCCRTTAYTRSGAREDCPCTWPSGRRGRDSVRRSRRCHLRQRGRGTVRGQDV